MRPVPVVLAQSITVGVRRQTGSLGVASTETVYRKGKVRCCLVHKALALTWTDPGDSVWGFLPCGVCVCVSWDPRWVPVPWDLRGIPELVITIPQTCGAC